MPVLPTRPGQTPNIKPCCMLLGWCETAGWQARRIQTEARTDTPTYPTKFDNRKMESKTVVLAPHNSVVWKSTPRADYPSVYVVANPDRYLIPQLGLCSGATPSF